jgi:DNA mismatch repair ATPase MutS
MSRTLGRASGWEPAIRAYVDWLGLAESTPVEAPYLRTLLSVLGAGDERASRRIRRFQRLVALADLRHNALMHFPVHAVTLWDFHVWAALEHWQRGSGPRVRAWVEALGALEALGSLATLAADHPDWSYPVVTEEAPSIDARALGHPLLPPPTCVRNDVRVGPAGRVLCITGSNMSGKSTLLRAIGVNVVLAQAGAPVCAAALSLPPVSVHTSLRVADSVTEGVSFFMAALARLKRLVQAAETAPRPGDERATPAILYLLDEVLQGTNSEERAVAVRIVLRHLLQTPAIGAITTHDLALTATPELSAAGDHVHFRETIADGPAFQMTFDYTLRPGVATSRNALALLRLVGLAGPDEAGALPG